MNEKGEVTLLALAIVSACILISGFLVAYKPIFTVQLHVEHRVGNRIVLAEMP